MKKTFLVILSVILATSAFSQKQTFDVVSYEVPKGWQQKQNNGSVQLLATDKKSGGYIMAIITDASASTATAIENFNSKWKAAIKDQIQLNGEPTMQPSSNDNGWDIETGSAGYTDNGSKGNVALLSATGGGQTVSVVIMFNTNQFEKDLSAFLNSLELAEVKQDENANTSSADTKNEGKSAIVGLWIYYTIETSGYSNGFPQPSGGYFRKEYAFYPDGTYLFRMKNWAVYVKEIQFVYESGTWKLNGNKLTITPKQGKGGWWSKSKSNRTDEWGSLAKTDSWKMEPVTYTVDLNFYRSEYERKVTLQSASVTEREGKQENNKIILESRAKDASLIDNPPGVKTGFENKSFSSSAKAAANNNPSAADINSPLVGKIWEAQTLEKFGSSGNSTYSGGFWKYQYKFNTDGTFQFVYSAASGLANNPVQVLQYETGTYNVNGNQLTINPLKGTNEEWSVGKINNGMSAELIRKVLKKRLTKLKSSARKLEKITYPISIKYWQGNEANALCLKHTQNTVREGSPGQNEQSCFFETTAAKAENFNGLFK